MAMYTVRYMYVAFKWKIPLPLHYLHLINVSRVLSLRSVNTLYSVSIHIVNGYPLVQTELFILIERNSI